MYNMDQVNPEHFDQSKVNTAYLTHQQIVSILVQSHNALMFVQNKYKYDTTLDQASRAALLAMINLNKLKNVFPAEWDYKPEPEATGFRRAHQAIDDAIGCLSHLTVDDPKYWQSSFGQARMELWAAAMNFADASETLNKNQVEDALSPLEW
jgi:hypothetical protein